MFKTVGFLVFTFCCLLLFDSFKHGQNAFFKLEKSVKIKGNRIYSDPLENYYYTSQNSICKTSSQNNLTFVYSNKKSGNITYIDAGDPMKIVVFYKDLSLITLLDNFLAEGSNIPLIDFGLDQSEVVCKALNNGIWVYDMKLDRLVKISNELKIESELFNIQRTIGEAFSPTQMLERNNGLYINDPEKGIFVFDNYGGFLKKIPELKIQKFNVINQHLVYLKNNEIFALNTETLETELWYTNSKISDFSLSEKKLFILCEDSLHIYKFKP